MPASELTIHLRSDGQRESVLDAWRTSSISEVSAKLAHDRYDAEALLAQRVDRFIALPGPGHCSAVQVSSGPQWDAWRRRRITRSAKAFVVLGDDLLDVLGEVVPQVPAVGDLAGLGGAGAGCLGVGTGPDTAEPCAVG